MFRCQGTVGVVAVIQCDRPGRFGQEPIAGIMGRSSRDRRLAFLRLEEGQAGADQVLFATIPIMLNRPNALGFPCRGPCQGFGT